MKNRILEQKRNLFKIFTSIFLVLFYIFQVSKSWPGLVSSRVRGPINYGDQEAILRIAKCFKVIGNDVYQSLEQNPKCGGFQYSIELLRFLNITHLSSVRSSVLGPVFLGLTIISMIFVIYILKSWNAKNYALAALCFSSPGIWLLLERGNFDELVVILVLGAALAIRTKYEFFGAYLLLASVFIKFYTLPVLFVYILFLKSKRIRNFYSLLLIPSTLYVLYQIKLVLIFPSTWYVSFGVKSMGLYIDLLMRRKILPTYLLPEWSFTLPGVLLILGIVGVMRKLRIQYRWKSDFHSAMKDRRYNVYAIMTAVFLTCFFAGMNYDYRLIFLAIPLCLIPEIFEFNLFAKIVISSGLAALFLSTFSYSFHGIPTLVIQFIGDVAASIFVSTQMLVAYDLLKRYGNKRSLLNLIRVLRN